MQLTLRLKGISWGVKKEFAGLSEGFVLEPIQRREQIENAWRARLEKAEAAWLAARAQYNSALTDYNRALSEPGEGPPPEFRLLVEQTASQEQAARAEYWRVLRIFIDLVVHRKLPDVEAG